MPQFARAAALLALASSATHAADDPLTQRYEAGVRWTGLGYTFNWGGDNSKPLGEQGASEFLLRPGSPYEIKGAVPAADYCKAPG